MAVQEILTAEEDLASFRIEVAGAERSLLDQATPMEIILGESLLTPGLQTSIKYHAYIHNLPPRNIDDFKNRSLRITIERKNLEKFKLNPIMNVDQIIYRCDNRKLIDNNIEEFTLHACDQTLLDDAATLVSKMWKCTTPSAVVREVLSTCAGAPNLDVESSSPARDYIAENIHPFQVVAQQANVALAGGDDPSFIHFMTYQNLGTHHFRSLYSMTRQSPVMEYFFAETGNRQGYAIPYIIMTYQFPCDFDLLSDTLNGTGVDGSSLSSYFSFNPLLKMFNVFGGNVYGCGIGRGVTKLALSNEGSAQQQNACPDYSKLYVQKRQARMGLLEQNKIALRLTVPWNPILNVGKTIRIFLQNKEDPRILTYGSGDYLIHSLTHNIKYGGFATITMDCVSSTVGQGIV